MLATIRARANCAASAYIAAGRQLHVAPWASTATFLLRNAARQARQFGDRMLVEARGHDDWCIEPVAAGAAGTASAGASELLEDCARALQLFSCCVWRAAFG